MIFSNISQPLPPRGAFQKGLPQVRRIQARLQGRSLRDTKPAYGTLVDPQNGAPYAVPVMSWID